MHLVLEGHKLKGEWILIKDGREPESNKWLLIKARESMKPLSAKADDTSAISKRSMAQIAKANDAQWQSNRPATTAKKSSRPAGRQMKPRFVAPMQCKPVTALPKEGKWSYEIKFDGYRALAVKSDGAVKLFSRNENLLNARFPRIIAALEQLPGNFAIDGEIVVLDDNGRPSFQLLQNNQSRSASVHFYAFDLLNQDGHDLLRLPIEERRAPLDQLMSTAVEPLRGSALLEASGSEVLDAVRKLGLEGVVGKRAGSIYESGDRSGAWIKHRTDRAQEFVVGGYIPATDGFDALLVGLYENKQLQYVAKVRNGFVPRIRNEIFPQLEKLRSECPFTNLPEKKSSRWGEAITAEKMKECRWVKPKLVVEVAFLEWTEGNHLRHCKFVALRDDKKARHVVRET
jgi:DNA ligase D-like protein (predicted ligase)